MSRRDTALYALESDPVRNRNWRRFIDPPPLPRRSPASLAGDARAHIVKHISDTDIIIRITAASQVRLAAEALFVRQEARHDHRA